MRIGVARPSLRRVQLLLLCGVSRHSRSAPSHASHRSDAAFSAFAPVAHCHTCSHPQPRRSRSHPCVLRSHPSQRQLGLLSLSPARQPSTANDHSPSVASTPSVAPAAAASGGSSRGVPLPSHQSALTPLSASDFARGAAEACRQPWATVRSRLLGSDGFYPIL